jgi:hypothetical protein
MIELRNFYKIKNLQQESKKKRFRQKLLRFVRRQGYNYFFAAKVTTICSPEVTTFCTPPTASP